MIIVNSYLYSSIIPASANIPSLEVWLDAREHTGADGSDITSVTDHSGNITSGITVANLKLNVTAGGIPEWDFTNTVAATMAYISLGNASNIEFDGTQDCTICAMMGSDAPGDSATIFAKRDKLGATDPAADITLYQSSTSQLFSFPFATGGSLGNPGGYLANDSLVCVTYDYTGGTNSTSTGWLNGSSLSSLNRTVINYGGYPWYIGAEYNSTLSAPSVGFPLAGTMKAFGIWSEVLTGTQMSNIRSERLGV